MFGEGVQLICHPKGITIVSFINLDKLLFSTREVPADADIVFVADAFVDEYVGGAELTTQALIDSTPFRVFRLKSSDVTMELLSSGHQKYWIFGNFANLNKDLIPSICANLKYSVIEYDYKFCKYRSREKHLSAEGVNCDCHNELNGKVISALLFAAQTLWWMSEKQQAIHNELFPFLAKKESVVLSSVFDEATFTLIKALKERQASSSVPRSGWVVCGGSSWIKGTDDAVEWCKRNDKEYEVVWGIPYDQLLEKLSRAEGLVFLPKGADTCPRLVLEARLLGCQLQLNDNVQHRDEIWFKTDDPFDTEAYLYAARTRFWDGIRADMDHRPTISGYTTTKDCISQDYPFVECITSMLGFCDEVVVVDGGSTDGTWEKLKSLSVEEKRLVIHQQPRDWSHKRFAVFDGAQKALARSLCTGDMCWQMDSDEIVHENDYKRITELARFMPRGIQMLSLPIVEYWGSHDKVRVDVNVSKWRLSWNIPTITHGIPAGMRRFDEDGQLYSAPGCDGCFPIRCDSYEMVPDATFMTQDVEQLRRRAIGDPAALVEFQSWFDGIVDNIPTVHHYSWL